MSIINRILLLLTALTITITLVSCSDTSDSSTPDVNPPVTEEIPEVETPDDENDQSDNKEDTGDIKEDGSDNGSEDKNEPVIEQDGLAEDGSYYRLTDKNGVVIKIPVGVPLNVASNGGITVDNTNAKRMRASAGEKASSEQRSVCIFSALSTYSIGYGNINHPCEDGYINDPSGTPYAVDDQHALVIQCFDEDYNEVSKDSPDVYYISIYVLDYLTNPGRLMFSETIDYSYAEGITLSYFTFSNIIIGTPHTQKSTYSSYDEALGEYVTVYRISENVTLRTPEGMHHIELKWWYCNPDWTTITRHENIYNGDDYFNPIGFVIYDHLDRVLYKHSIDENGNF